MGMNNTFYNNASGLPDPLQVTTASDLSILARRLRTDFPQYFPYFSTPGFYYRGVNYVTHDNLIGRYEGTDGMKTGYTGMSGFNLVSSVERDGRRIVGVVMGGRTARKRDNEMMALLDNAYGVKSYTPPTTVLASNDATAPQPAVPQQKAPAAIPLFSLANLFPKPKPPMPRNNSVLRSSASDDDEDSAEKRVADDDPILPKPKPIVIAAYKPQKPKQVAHIDLGEGDIGDMPKSTASLGGQKWTIQIGAYADATAARAQLAHYAERSMDVLGQAARLVMPFQSVDGHKLYRARFGPFAEKEARAVCATLSKRGQTCFAASTN
jgi:D-alanyl-D-alanine carboxypeptidase